MDKINFQNKKLPALNATNLNQLQTNVENAINSIKEVNSSTKAISTSASINTNQNFLRIYENYDTVTHTTKTGKVKITACGPIRQTTDGNYDVMLRCKIDDNNLTSPIARTNIEGWHYLAGQIEVEVPIGTHTYTLGIASSDINYYAYTRVYSLYTLTVEDV